METNLKTLNLLTAIMCSLLFTFSNNAHANAVHDKLKSVDATPLRSVEGKSMYKAIYVICKSPRDGVTTMYRVTHIRRHYQGNSRATLRLYNGYSEDVYMDRCQVLRIA